ncbi:MAG: hypothetical protein IRZ16_22000 [Myxococcaceae bacterium]|nr:hypothetical protein [Myxococcaceae bacterium]
MHDRHPSSRRLRFVQLVGVVLAVTTLSGCFDLLEEIWIAPDGSARMTLDVALAMPLLRLAGQDPFTKMQEDAKRTKAALEQDPAVKRFDFRTFEEGDVRHLVYELEVTDATKLAEIQHRVEADAADAARKADELRFAFERVGGGRLVFTQQIGRGAVTPGSDGGSTPSGGAGEGDVADNLGRAMAQAMLAGHAMTVRLHAPRIGQTNGTLNEKQDTVEWRIPVADVMAGSAKVQELRAEIELGAPVWVWGLFIGVPALLLLLAVSAMKRRRGQSLPRSL